MEHDSDYLIKLHEQKPFRFGQESAVEPEEAGQMRIFLLEIGRTRVERVGEIDVAILDEQNDVQRALMRWQAERPF